MSHQFDVCFVGLKCYDLLSSAPVPRYLGGIEKQLVSFARGFADQGYRVAFIVYDHGQDDVEIHNGITVIKSYEPEAGLPVLRFLFPRMKGLWQAMARADARVYIEMGAGDETGRVAMGAKRLGSPFVFIIASDSDCLSALPLLKQQRQKVLYKYGLKRAGAVVGQTRQQQDMLKENFDVTAQVISMPYVASKVNVDHVAVDRGRVLWIARIIEVKRLEWLLDVAEICTELQFDVVGVPNQDSDYYQGLKDRAATIDNVTMHGKLAEADLPVFFKRAGVLCCTSVLEGVPTTFLEAWSSGVPLVSTFDPDNVIDRMGLGLVAKTQEEVAEHLRRITSSEDLRAELSERVKKYYWDTHSAEAVVPRLAAILDGV